MLTKPSLLKWFYLAPLSFFPPLCLFLPPHLVHIHWTLKSASNLLCIIHQQSLLLLLKKEPGSLSFSESLLAESTCIHYQGLWAQQCWQNRMPNGTCLMWSVTFHGRHLLAVTPYDFPWFSPKMKPKSFLQRLCRGGCRTQHPGLVYEKIRELGRGTRWWRGRAAPVLAGSKMAFTFFIS